MPAFTNTVVCLSSGSPYHWLKRSKVASRGSKAPVEVRAYCERKSQPPRSVRSASLYSAATVRKPLSPSAKPFQPDTVSVSPSERERFSTAGADQVAPAGGVPVRFS